MDAWAQLVSTTDICIEPVKITKQKFVIGRAHDADLCLHDNRLVSGHHCFIEKDPLGNIWLQDISTNGTVLNSTNKISGKRVLLKHGDEVFIVFRNADSDLNVAFLFQDLEELRREELDTTVEANGGSDETLPYEDDDDDSLMKPEDKITEGANKRHLELADGDSDKEPAAKLVKKLTEMNDICREESVASSSKLKCKHRLRDEMELTITCLTTEHNPTPNPLIGSHQSSHPEQTPSSEKPPEGGDAAAQVNSELPLSKEMSVLEPSTSSGVAAPSNRTSDVPELLEDQLICTICQEILYNSVCLQPCMHIFCAGCYSGWMDRSSECPTCRQIVIRIKKYHPMKNVIEAYLTACPEKQRPEEERKRLDAADRIKDDMRPHLPNHPVDADYEDDGDDEDVSEEEVDRIAILPPAPFYVFPNPRPPRTICRQCPEYQGPRPASGSSIASPVVPPAVTLTSAASVNEASSSRAGMPSLTTGPSAKTYPDPPAFTCSLNRNHILCLCCLQPMPHRWNDAHWGVVPPQQCALCHRAFCHLYWGCFGQCDGCLAKFADMKFRSEVLNTLILQNIHESKGFRLYLESKRLTIDDVQRTCVRKLRDGVYSCPDDAFLLGSDFPICYNCSLRNFSQLAFEFRRDVPESDMPVEFRGRPNCRWGRGCRTQTHNQRHAETYNHICEESRQRL